MCKTALCKLVAPAECQYRVDGNMSFTILCGGNELFDAVAKCPYRALAEIKELAATTANNAREEMSPCIHQHNCPVYDNKYCHQKGFTCYRPAATRSPVA
jgi:hypothetical protein